MYPCPAVIQALRESSLFQCECGAPCTSVHQSVHRRTVPWRAWLPGSPPSLPSFQTPRPRPRPPSPQWRATGRPAAAPSERCTHWGVREKCRVSKLIGLKYHSCWRRSTQERTLMAVQPRFWCMVRSCISPKPRSSLLWLCCIFSQGDDTLAKKQPLLVKDIEV
ncbi:hypothetical protein GN956_G15808 [Arapaima gigas]